MVSMCRQFAAKFVLFFSVACLLLVVANEVIAFSVDGTTEVCSSLELEEEVDQEILDVDLLLGFQAAFEFKPSPNGLVANFSTAAACSHAPILILLRGPPTSWL